MSVVIEVLDYGFRVLGQKTCDQFEEVGEIKQNVNTLNITVTRSGVPAFVRVKTPDGKRWATPFRLNDGSTFNRSVHLGDSVDFLPGRVRLDRRVATDAGEATTALTWDRDLILEDDVAQKAALELNSPGDWSQVYVSKAELTAPKYVPEIFPGHAPVNSVDPAQVYTLNTAPVPTTIVAGGGGSAGAAGFEPSRSTEFLRAAHAALDAARDELRQTQHALSLKQQYTEALERQLHELKTERDDLHDELMRLKDASASPVSFVPEPVANPPVPVPSPIFRAIGITAARGKAPFIPWSE